MLFCGLRRAAAAGAVLYGLAGCSMITAQAQSAPGVPKDWQRTDLGAFSFMAPPSLHKLEGQAIDAQAGRLQSEALTLHYDAGLYADPLAATAELRDHSVRNGLLDGLAARFVGFTYAANAQGQLPAQPYCEGVHVPQVRRSSMGAIRLTLLVCGKTPGDLAVVQSLFASVKFGPGALR